MPRMRDFEDKVSADWPLELKEIAHAAEAVYTALAELDEVAEHTRHVAGGTLQDHGPFLALTGDAYRLLAAIRAEGERQLAKWEEGQQLVKRDQG